ncbi:MAG TPA: 23S rRNA (guanosine(2251)-2'-O)-methyltransferase RlmB [Egibacteraceae bacterium]|nr:23S rRNA (guanosine(2251)-2'-O)-methyltransferase RlmB [Egibacteraceae bacterium]
MPHVIPGRRSVAEALRAGRRLRKIHLERTEGALGVIAEAAREAGVPVRSATRDELDELTGGVRHQGAVGIAEAFSYASLEQVGDSDLLVVLDGVTDPQNLGAIARSAEAAGAGGLVISRRRSAHVTPAAERAAAGAFSWLPVAEVPNIARALADLAERGVWSVGLDADGPPLWDCELLDGKVAVVLGAEGKGLSRLVAERVDALASIPMPGRLASLNVSAAAAVALFEVVRRRSLND